MVINFKPTPTDKYINILITKTHYCIFNRFSWLRFTPIKAIILSLRGGTKKQFHHRNWQNVKKQLVEKLLYVISAGNNSTTPLPNIVVPI